MESNKTEILSFDEWINGNGFNFRPEQYDLYKFLYESGQQSKQAEVDELRKRIDEALKELEYIHFYKTQNSNNAIKILNGDSHES